MGSERYRLTFWAVVEILTILVTKLDACEVVGMPWIFSKNPVLGFRLRAGEDDPTGCNLHFINHGQILTSSLREQPLIQALSEFFLIIFKQRPYFVFIKHFGFGVRPSKWHLREQL